MGRNAIFSFFQSASTLGRARPKVVFYLFLILAFIILFPVMSYAADNNLEKDVQTSLEQSRAIVIIIRNKIQSDSSISAEIAQLKKEAENIRVSHMLLDERFKLREEKIKSLGYKAQERHQAMAEGYRKALTDYLALIDEIPLSSQETVDRRQEKINKLKNLLDKITPKKKRQIIGSLPYKHLNYPAVEPSTASEITPAYRGGNKTVTPDDTKSTESAPISKTISELAQSLNWQPVAIYEYVKNSIETEWYWGCQKGAEETLRQKSGNDCDQALLLSALLKSAGFPTRLVRANIQFFASDDKPIERVKNLIGIDDPWKIAEFFQKAGIPYKPIIAGGTIRNFEISHIYVESLIPMANYRGVVIDELGKTWLGLDTSIKTTDYVYNNAKDIFQEPGVSSQLSGVRDEYLSAVQTLTPLEFLQSRINSELGTLNSELTYSNFLRTRTLPPHNMKILPYGMQFIEKTITGEYTDIPDELTHKVRFIAKDTQNSELLNVELDTYKLSNQQVAISYEPESVEDQAIINSYGGLDNTPSYLVRLRSVLKINNERIVVAAGGLPMGSDYNLTIEIYSPSINGSDALAQTITNTLIVGNLSVIGITAGKAALTPSPLAGEGGGEGEKDAERLLYEAAQHYIDRWNQAEDELASLLHLTIARPLPTVITVGGVIDIDYLLDMPHGFTWKGVYVDADLRTIEIVRNEAGGVRGEAEKIFMQLSSLQGSVLENRIFEDDFQVESISTAKLIGRAQGTEPGIQMLTIDKANINTVLPTLTLDDNVKEDITNAVNQNLTVYIPQTTSYALSAINYMDWAGIGWIKENATTGESGWMLSGSIAGGMTAKKKEQWINQDIANELSLPYTPGVNQDPNAVATLVRINRAMGDYQKGTVGEQLYTPFEVMARDSTGRAVKGVLVTFKTIAGGGVLMGANPDGSGNPITGTEITVKTGPNGIAWAVLTLGQETTASPYWLEDTPHWTLVGLNQVTASAQAATGTIYTDKPFEAYGRPGKAVKITKVSGDQLYGSVNTFSGTISTIVQDQYDNPVSNQTVTFTVRPQDFGPIAPTGADIQNAAIFGNTEDCPMPAVRSCPTATTNLSKQTDSSGALAYVIMGNTDDTLYTIRAQTTIINQQGQSQNLFVDFQHYVAPRPRTGGKIADPYLSVVSVYSVDEKGREIDAGNPGQVFPEKLTAAMYFTQEKPVEGTCQGSRIFTTEPVTDATMRFTPTQGGGSVNPTSLTSGQNGFYSTTLSLGPQREKHYPSRWIRNQDRSKGGLIRKLHRNHHGI